MYGFHPDEPLAEEIGKNLSRSKMQGVEAIRFRAKCMPDNLHTLSEEDATPLEAEAYRKLKRYIKENYGRVGLILNLHETPVLIEHDRPQYEILFPGWNHKLRKVLHQFEKDYRDRVWALACSPAMFSHYHSAIVEYFSRVKRDGDTLLLTKTEGEEFAGLLIDYLTKNYLGKTQAAPQI